MYVMYVCVGGGLCGQDDRGILVEAVRAHKGSPGEVRLKGSSARVLLGTRVGIVRPRCRKKQ